MKKVKILSTFMALSLASGALTAISAGAMTPQSYSTEKFADCIELDSNKYMKICDDSRVIIYNIFRQPDHITLTTNGKADITAFANIVKSVNENFIFQDGFAHSSDGTYVYGISGNNGIITRAEAKELSKLLSPYVISFEYTAEKYSYSYGVYSYITAYDATQTDPEETLKAYISESGLNAEIIRYSEGDTDINGNIIDYDIVYVVPAEKLPPAEHYRLAKQIESETGLISFGISPTTFNNMLSEEKIDGLGVDGDANCDGKVNIADAAFVMQDVGNRDKYKISVQGKFNADSDGDGLTALDALAIQKKIANIE